jgi:hypothetical protein
MSEELDIHRVVTAAYLRPGVPEISRFLGVVVAMFYADHPPPHFHVRYGEQRAIIEIETMRLVDGWLSPRVRGLVTEWGVRHRETLRENWRLAREHAPLRAIEPLE